MTRTTRWLLALALLGTVVVELVAGPPRWSMVVDGGVAVGLFYLAAVVIGNSRRYALICAGTGVAWLLPWLVEGTDWLHRPLLVWAVLSFADGRLRRPWGPLVVLGVAVAGLLPASGARVALAALGVLTVLAAARGRGPDAAWPTVRTAPRTRAAVWAGTALWVPLLALLFADTTSVANVRVEQAREVGYALLLGASVTILVSAASVLEGEETESVLALSEAEGTDATLVRLRAAAATAADAPTRRALGSAIAMLEQNLSLQRDLTGAADEVRASRRRLAAALERERRMLRTRLAEQAVPTLTELAVSVRRIRCDDVDEHGRLLLDQCRSDVAAIADDLTMLAEGLYPAALSRAGLLGLTELAAHSPVRVEVHLPTTRLPPDIEAALWFSCTELLANAVKHADPSRVTVSGAIVDGHVAVEIHDDGVGGASFVADGGLASLRDRLRAVDGTLTLASPRNGGTTVRMEVPLP